MNRAALLVVSVVLVVAGSLAVVERTHDFTGYCVGGNEVTDDTFDPVVLDATVTDPLHLSASVDLRRARPQRGDRVSMVGGGVPEPGLRAVVVATGPETDGELPVVLTPDPEDGLPTLVPGRVLRITVETNSTGKTETISADSLRPRPATMPGPATVFVAGRDGLGPIRPHPVTVSQIVGDRAVAGDDGPDAVLANRTVGTPVPVVVPDHHCRTAGVWPIVLRSTRRWDAGSDTVQPG